MFPAFKPLPKVFLSGPPRHTATASGRPSLPRAGFIQILSPGQARDTTVQVWTVVEGFGIGSEFRQTRCAANDFRDHQFLFRWFQMLQSFAHLLDLRALLFQGRS